MKAYIASALFLALSISFLSGCSGDKRAKDGDTVKVHYTGRLDDGTVFDSSLQREPLEVVIGSGTMFPVFEIAIIDMAVGDTKTITIPSDEAFGPKYDELVGTIGRNQIAETIAPSVGQQLQMRRPDSSVFVVTIMDVTEDSLTLDANHPLAGKDLIFDIELVEIL